MLQASPRSAPQPGTGSSPEDASPPSAGPALVPLGSAEPVLLTGTQRWYHILSWPISWVFLLLVAINPYGPERFGNPVPLLAASVALLLYFSLRHSGTFWLTPKRLVWKPRFGEAVQVSLDSIASGGITHQQAWGQVRVVGERLASVSHASQASRLAAMLELHRHAPLLGQVDGRPRVREVAIFEAWRSRRQPEPGQRAEPGVAVLRPGYVAFLPERRQAQALRGLLGPGVSDTKVEVPLELVVEQLRLLPEAEFDRYVEQAVRASGGELWAASEVHRAPVPAHGRDYPLLARERVLWGRPGRAQLQVISRVAQQWPS